MYIFKFIYKYDLNDITTRLYTKYLQIAQIYRIPFDIFSSFKFMKALPKVRALSFVIFVSQ